MPSVLNICALALLGGAIAQDHHIHKRQPEVVEVTVHNTVWVTAGAEGAQKQAAATPAVEKETSSEASAVTSAVAASSTSEASSVASSASSSASASSSGSDTSPEEGSGDAGALGITYSPYANDGSCKSADTVKSEVSKLSGYKVIRLYGTDCSQVENVAAAIGDNQKLFLGVFDVSDVASQCKAIATALNNDFSKVHTISIGNELVNGGQASVSQVKQYVDTGRSTLQGLGYTGPVTTVDTFIATINNPDLCDVGDYVSCNAHAFFDGNVAAEQAGEWLVGNIQRVSAACGGKKTIITESGWPSEGETNGKAVCGSSQQKAAIDSIKKACGDDTFLFTAYNDYWKAPGAFAAEQHWGIYSS